MSFKQKLEYQGSYLEEWIDVEKVKCYFNWFKKNNPLFKQVELSEELINQFENESVEHAKEFEDLVADNENSTVNEKCLFGNQEVQDEIYESDDDDSTEGPIGKCSDMDQMSIFCNKYETDTNLPTVVNKMADMIIDFECKRNIETEIEDDFEQEYEDVKFENEEDTIEEINDECSKNERKSYISVEDEIYYSSDEEMETYTSEEEKSYHEIEEELYEENEFPQNKEIVAKFQPIVVEAQTLTQNRTFVKDSLNEDNDNILEGEEMDAENLEQITRYLLPSIQDVCALNLSENPLASAKEIFLKCEFVISNSNKNLKNKELKFMNEIGIKLMEMLDYLCSASDEKKN